MWQVNLRRSACMCLYTRQEECKPSYNPFCVLLQVGDETGGSTVELTGHTDTVSSSTCNPSIEHTDLPYFAIC